MPLSSLPCACAAASDNPMHQEGFASSFDVTEIHSPALIVITPVWLSC